MNIKLCLLLAILFLIAGCAITPDMVRRRPATDMQVINAPRPAVAACISKRLKETKTTSQEVIEGEKFVQLKADILGEITVRLYDLDDAVGGTMVTLFARNLEVYETEAKLVIEHCRAQLATSNSQR